MVMIIESNHITCIEVSVKLSNWGLQYLDIELNKAMDPINVDSEIRDSIKKSTPLKIGSAWGWSFLQK